MNLFRRTLLVTALAAAAPLAATAQTGPVKIAGLF